jgi:type IV fimbrial biogenesis protein FimT
MQTRMPSRERAPHTSRARGLTLLELCFGLGLLALLAGLAAPGFKASLRTAAVRSATFDLLVGLQQTRAQAILESRPGTLCPADAAGNCQPASAPAGAWHAFLEGRGPGEIRGRNLPPGVQLRASRSPLRFWPHSFAASTGTLTICDAHQVAAPRAIVVSQTGRARLVEAPSGACRS